MEDFTELCPAGYAGMIRQFDPKPEIPTGLSATGLEYTLGENRLHFTVPEGRLHFTLKGD